MVKLTLSADEEVVKTARVLSRRNRTSISAMFSRMIRAADKQSLAPDELPPITVRASGIISLGHPDEDKRLIAEALVEQYSMPE
jgi:hypothetical protein